MDISIGFLIAFVLIIFPGLIFRRLYYYNEFSKQFNSGLNIPALIAISALPGLVLLIITSLLYDTYFNNIDLGEIIDIIKKIISDEHLFTENNEIPLKTKIYDKASPYLGFLYVSSVVLGLISGRLIRILRLDTKFKILRFKNYWFYFFNSQHTRFPKMRPLKVKGKKHLFTWGDILINSDGNKLYSGYIMDYELDQENCDKLSKIYLRDAIRYDNNGEKKPIIPSQIFILDCKEMVNINLTYIYKEREDIRKTKIPQILNIWLSVINIVIAIFLIFKTNLITWSYYQEILGLSYGHRILFYLLVIQILSLANIFIKNKEVDSETGILKEEYNYIGIEDIIYKVALIGFFFLLFRLSLFI
ncbi:hypothetical protein [Tenacibaculum agarivorans]|uniref:hypothetical protein n=1 Tax=Tenacibaculum agarivorans TaxID=1908389 RepID=UPI00094BBA16|nr:hypothetical protein [Tenacibaculum agarivorans]